MASSVSYVSLLLIFFTVLVSNQERFSVFAQLLPPGVGSLCTTPALGCPAPACVALSSTSCVDRVPCRNITDSTLCAASGCQMTSNSRCTEVSCIGALSERECGLVSSGAGTAAGPCQWNATLGVCLHRYCTGAAVQVCVNENMYCTAAGSVCVDKALTQMPCVNVTNDALCAAQMPLGRCAFTNGKCAEAVLTPCNSVRATPTAACPAHCVQGADSVCVDPSCPGVMTSTACKTRGCVWSDTSAPSCVDPNVGKLACSSFSVTNCPPDRCQATFSGCVNKTLSPIVSCGDISDAATCAAPPLSSNLAGQCFYNETARSCQTIPCARLSQSSCPLSRCRWLQTSCVEACPVGYVLCDSGNCAQSKDQCTTCSSNQFQCWDSSCKSKPADCNCSPLTPKRCSDGSCVMETAPCNVTCSSAEVRCPDNSCAATLADCPCPTAMPIRCPSTGRCVADITSCDKQCLDPTPVMCWNGECAVNNASCSCQSNQVLCPTDKSCRKSLLECPCAEAGAVRCTTEPFNCAMNCSAKCSGTTPFQCPDGSCAFSALRCPCVEASAMPTITLNAVATEVAADSWLRVAANVDYTVCGKDRSAAVGVSWSVSYSNGTAYTPGRAAAALAVLVGQTAAFPPHYFAVNGASYTITAVAALPNLSAKPSNSVSLRPYYPTPVIAFIGGGARRVSVNAATTVAVQVADPNPWPTTAGRWSCCTGTPCEGTCGASVADALSSAGSKREVTLTPTAAGVLTLKYIYGNMFTTFYLDVVGYTVLNVMITPSQERLVVTKPLMFYAATNASDKISSITWLLNGESVAQRTGATVTNRMVQFAANTLSTNVMYNLTAVVSSGSRSGAASFTFSLQPMPTMTCSVAAIDTTAAGVVALETKVRITATLANADQFAFRFGFLDYADRTMRAWRNVSLSQAWQNVPTLDFVAPTTIAVAAAGAAKEVKFAVFARYEKEDDVAWAWCTLVIQPSTQNTSSVVASSKASLENARANSDLGSVLRETATLSGTDDGNSTRRGETLTAVVAAISSVAGTGVALSTEQRSAVVQSLRSLTANVTVSERQKASILDVLRATLNSDTNASSVGTSDSKFSPARDGKAALDTLSMLLVDSNVSKTTEALAVQLAAAAPLGVPSTLTANNISVSSVRVPASDFGGSTLRSSTATILIPSSFTVTGATASSEVAVTSAEYNSTPYASKNPLHVVASSVVDFGVLQDGSAVKVANLTDPLQLNLTARWTPRANETVVCKYYDEVNKVWSTVGVQTLAFDNRTQAARCTTTHLSSFALFMVMSAPTNNNGNGDDGNDGGAGGVLSTGAVAGIALAGVFIIVVLLIVLCYVKCCKTDEGELNSKDGPKNLQHPSSMMEEGQEMDSRYGKPMQYNPDSLVEL